VHAFIAAGDIEKAIQAQAEIRGHVIVPIECGRVGQSLRDEFATILSDTIDVRENTELGVMENEQFAFEILQAKGRMKFLRKDGHASVGMEAKNPSFRGIRAG
jgi:hypothetical protein